MSKLSIYFLVAIFLVFAPTNVFAAKKSSLTKSSLAIVIKGNERVDPQTIESYLEISELKQGSQKAINQSIKKSKLS